MLLGHPVDSIHAGHLWDSGVAECWACRVPATLWERRGAHCLRRSRAQLQRCRKRRGPRAQCGGRGRVLEHEVERDEPAHLRPPVRDLTNESIWHCLLVDRSQLIQAKLRKKEKD